MKLQIPLPAGKFGIAVLSVFGSLIYAISQLRLQSMSSGSFVPVQQTQRDVNNNESYKLTRKMLRQSKKHDEHAMYP